jgi:hypothetical protein
VGGAPTRRTARKPKSSSTRAFGRHAESTHLTPRGPAFGRTTLLLKHALVLVTGGTGFIGSWCVLTLLDAGHTVRTTARDLRREPAPRSWLHAVAPFDDDRPTVVRADLEHPDGWDDAVTDCDYVLHLASPTLRRNPANDDELVVPAREGVLQALRDAGVRRVVLTTNLDSDIPPSCWSRGGCRSPSPAPLWLHQLPAWMRRSMRLPLT